MNQINNVDFNLLKSLRTLLAEKHVGRAAERMNITQSAMSHTLSRLRDAFDDPLFIRTSKGLEPTSRALELAEPLDAVLGSIQALIKPQTFEPESLTLRFRIHTHEFIAASYLPRMVSDITSKAPNMVFDLKNYTEESYSLLENNEVDLIIGSGLDAKEHFKQKELYQERLVCLMAPNHQAAKGLTIDSFFAHPQIRISALNTKNDPIHRYAIQHKIRPPKIAMYTETLSMQLPFLCDSDALAVVPESLAKMGVKQNGLVSQPCPFDLPAISIKALWHERNQNDAVHKWLRGFFHSVS